MTTWAAAAAVAAALAACSGGSGERGAAPDPAASMSVPGSAVGPPPEPGTDEFCAAVAASLKEGFGLGSANATSPEAMRQAFESSRTRSEATLAGAPAEIRPDLQVLAAAVAKVSDALAAANYDIAAVGPEAGIIETFGSPEVQRAATRTLAFVKERCGIDAVPSPTAPSPDQGKS